MPCVQPPFATVWASRSRAAEGRPRQQFDSHLAGSTRPTVRAERGAATRPRPAGMSAGAVHATGRFATGAPRPATRFGVHNSAGCRTKWRRYPSGLRPLHRTAVASNTLDRPRRHVRDLAVVPLSPTGWTRATFTPCVSAMNGAHVHQGFLTPRCQWHFAPSTLPPKSLNRA